MSTQPQLEPIHLQHPIDPTVDCVFKALFGQEDNKALLIHFLNGILRPTSPIEDVTYLNPIHEPRTEEEKLTIIDIHAIDTNKVTYQIEMQLRNHKALTARMLHNWSSLYQRLAVGGDDFERLTPVISIWLLGQKLLPTPAHHHHFQVWDATHRVCLSDHFHIHTLELKKWRRPAEGSDQNPEDLWFDFFRHAKHWQELPAPLSQHPQMRQAMTVLKHFSDDDRARYEYERRMKLLSLQTTLDNERKEAQEELQKTKEQLKETNDQLKESKERLEQSTALVEQKSDLLEQASARAQQEAARAQQEAARAQQAQIDLQNQIQSLRQNLKNLYSSRFNAPIPTELCDALDTATPDQLNAWLLRFATASPEELLALASP